MGDSPSWAEFTAALRSQMAEVGELLARQEERNDAKFQLTLQSIQASERNMREYVDSLKANANLEHKALGGRINSIWGVLGTIFSVIFLGIVFAFVSRVLWP